MILLSPAASHPHNVKIAAKARAIIEAIKAGRAQGDILDLFAE